MKSWVCETALGLVLALAGSTATAFAADPPKASGAAAPAAATAAAAPAPSAPASAVQVLLDKSNYWRLKDRPDLAVAALQQLLSINPNEPDALYQYGMLDVQQGKIEDAKGYLGRLQRAAPSSPHIADLENAIRAGQVSPSQLNEARRLAQTGQFAQAAKEYEQSFRGPPPSTFGVEYYMTLAGTQQGWDQARRGLEGLVQTSPNDSKAKLALAEVLTYHADTRAQGIRMLSQLSNDPVVGQQAANSWKQALMWLGGQPQERELYNQYLSKFPQDTDLKAHIAEAEKPGAANFAAPGFADLNRGNLAAAEREFETELRRDPNDPNALAGMGILRLRQRRLADAKELLGRAISGYRRILASTPNDAAAQSGLRGASAALRSAETAGLPGPPGPPANPIRARSDAARNEGKALEGRGDTLAAQAKYQEAVAIDPNNAWARLDYARFLARRGDATQGFQVIDPAASGSTAESFQAAAIFYNEQNRTPEALALLDRIPPGQRTADIAAFRDSILVVAEVDRAKQLANSGNTAGARNELMALYAQPPQTAAKAQAVAAALADIGDVQEALQIGRPSGASANDPKATLAYAGLLFQAGRDAEAVAYLQQAERTGRITAAERRDLEHVKIDIAVRRADTLRERGDIAGAYDQISPLLSAYPNDADLLLAAGRIYAAAGQGSIAMRFIDAAYRQAPGDINVLRGVVGGAIVAGDLDRAQAYLAAGMRLYPNNPRLYYLAAQIARANGDNGTAVYYLAMARRLDTGGQAAAAMAEPVAVPGAPPPIQGTPAGLPPNPFRQSQADPAQADPSRPLPVMLAAATDTVSATDATPQPAPPLPPPPSKALSDAAVSADSADLVVPPQANARPPRAPVAASLPAAPRPPRSNDLAMLPSASDSDVAPPWRTDPSFAPQQRPQLAQAQAPLQALPPPPIPGYQPSGGYYTPAASYAPTAAYQPAPAYPTAADGTVLQPLPPPPIQGYQAPLTSEPVPAPRNSLELDIERSMADINAETGPILQGGFAFRERGGEDGLSGLTEIGAPIEGIFSPFYTGTVRLQVTPDYIDAGTPSLASLSRFGRDALLGANPIPAGGQTAGGVALNAGYAYSYFAGEVGTTPLGFPVDNIIGRIALMWPGPATLTTAYPTIPPPTTGSIAQPFHVKVEGIRQPITDSLLSFAGTRDPVSGQIWGGVVKTGGDLLVSYDDGYFGAYVGGGASSLDGQAVASNSEVEGLVGAYIRPYRTTNTALKVGLNLAYMGYDKNLDFFSFGQGGYFSPQNYVNISVPVEYTGRSGRLSWLTGAALGLQAFHASSSPYFPTDAGAQAALAASGNPSVYPGQNVTGPSFFINGQLEYQLDNGFSIGGIASVDNAQNYTEGIAKVYLRKSFGVMPANTAVFPNPFAGSL